MTEKRFKVAVYDEKAINGFTVLDLHKPNISKRLKYENVYIGSKEGCDIVCKFGNELAEENEQLKHDATVLIYSNQEYREKNEQLKQAIAETEKMVQSTYDELTKLRCFRKNILRIKHSWDYLMGAIQYD